MIVTRVTIVLTDQTTINFSINEILTHEIQRKHDRYITLRWDDDRWTEIPWDSILRIDYVRFDTEDRTLDQEKLPFREALPVGYAESASPRPRIEVKPTVTPR